MSWPQTPPDDLHYALATVLSYRSKGPVDVYAAFREWAERHGLPAPQGAWTKQAPILPIYEDLEPRRPGEDS
jgi:hypothetical protein